jgi:hypothetical protein
VHSFISVRGGWLLKRAESISLIEIRSRRQFEEVKLDWWLMAETKDDLPLPMSAT